MNRDSREIRSDRQPGSMVGVGISIGAGFGVALGLVLDNLALGIAMGVAIGTAIGAILSGRTQEEAHEKAAVGGASLPLFLGLALILLLAVVGIALLLVFGADRPCSSDMQRNCHGSLSEQATCGKIVREGTRWNLSLGSLLEGRQCQTGD